MPAGARPRHQSRDGAGGAARRSKQRRRGAAARGLGDLAGLVEQMQEVVADRDRLRQAVEQIRAAINQARR
jgi:hypothetical protein